MNSPSVVFYLLLLALLYFTGSLLFFGAVVLFSLLGAVLFRSLSDKYLQIPTPEKAAVLITGSSTGIGKEVALHLVAQGFSVIAGVRKTADGDALVQALPQDRRAKLLPLLLDVTKKQQVAESVAEVEKLLADKGLYLYGLVNNAGIVWPSPLEVISEERLQAQFDVNVTGAWRVTKAYAILLRKAKESHPEISPRLLFTGSLASYYAVANFGGYSATKAAVEHLGDQFRQELAQFGIRVTVIQPGTFQTSIQTHWANSQTEFEEAVKVLESPQVIEKYKASALPLIDFVANGNDPAPWNKIGLITDAYQNALLARFPPNKRTVGYEAHVLGILSSVLPGSVVETITSLMKPPKTSKKTN